MTNAYYVESSKMPQIQAAVMDIIQNQQSTYVFKTYQFDRVPPPQELSPSNGTSKLPAAIVLTPRKVGEFRANDLRELDWEIDVVLIWSYKGKNTQDETLKNALSFFEDLFAIYFDLEGTCAPETILKNSQTADWAPKDRPTSVQWKTVSFTVCAHEDLDFDYMPPL